MNATNSTSDLRAFHGKAATKKKYLGRVEAHRKADRLVRGVGAEGAGKNFRGCAIGCTLEVYDHARYPTELGIPMELARLEDRLFEGMPVDKAMQWPGEFLRAIPVGADLSDVWPKFVIWLLKDVRKHARPDGKKAIDTVVSLYRERAPRGDKRWSEARSASAAASAAYASAAASAAAYAAYAAAAAAYAASAAYAAYASAAAYAAAAYAADAAAAYAAAAYAAAKSGASYRQSRRLLDILRHAPVRRVKVA